MTFQIKHNICMEMKRENCRKAKESIDHLLLHCHEVRHLGLKLLQVGLFWAFPARCKSLMVENREGLGLYKNVKSYMEMHGVFFTLDSGWRGIPEFLRKRKWDQ